MSSCAPSLASPTSVPVREHETDVVEDARTDSPWDVIVWDDPVNLMSYVVYVLRKVFGFNEPVARKLMLEVHHQGKALVASEPREKAEMFVHQLHGHGLQATIQRSQ